jgi:ferredoxin
MISPLVIGIFEFTMMRTGEGLNTKHWAHLFHDYMEADDAYYRANCGDDKRVFPLRALPHEGTVESSDHVEVMDYEKASAIVDSHKIFAVALCSCRHEKMHLGLKKCDVPLETCTTMGPSAYYMINHNLAKKISKTEMHELLARSREMGLVICADNIKDAPSFFCNCCGCCCNVMLGISQHGYAHSVVTSNYIAECKTEDCAECGNCAEACPINAISMQPDSNPKIDTKFCMGCGVCALKCSTGAIRLTPRKHRVLHHEDTFERIILQSLERGTLQNQLFTDTQSITHAFMRGFVGGFLKLPPVKKALMSDTLRSSFLDILRKGQR